MPVELEHARDRVAEDGAAEMPDVELLRDVRRGVIDNDGLGRPRRRHAGTRVARDRRDGRGEPVGAERRLKYPGPANRPSRTRRRRRAFREWPARRRAASSSTATRGRARRSPGSRRAASGGFAGRCPRARRRTRGEWRPGIAVREPGRRSRERYARRDRARQEERSVAGNHRSTSWRRSARSSPRPSSESGPACAKSTFPSRPKRTTLLVPQSRASARRAWPSQSQ